MGAATAVGCDDRPAVGADPVVVVAASHQTRLDRDDQAGPERQSTTGASLVVYERILVHRPSDAVAGGVVLDAVARLAPDDRHRVPDVAHPAAGLCRLDADRETAPGRRGPVEVRLARRPDYEADRRVRVPAVDVRPEVDTEQIAVAQSIVGRQSVQHDVVDRGTDDSGVWRGREVRVVAEERRPGARVVEDLARGLVELAKRNPDRRLRPHLGMDRSDDPTGRPHRLDLAGGLELDHGVPSPSESWCNVAPTSATRCGFTPTVLL